MFDQLRAGVFAPQAGKFAAARRKAEAYRAHFGEPMPMQRAHAAAAIFENTPVYLYEGDEIHGSLRGAFEEVSKEALQQDISLCASYGDNNFWTNADHYAPDYGAFLAEGLPGRLARIDEGLAKYAGDQKKTEVLRSMKVALNGLRGMILRYAEAARGAAAEALFAIADRAPATFREALQLVWITHTAFCLEGRYAMALGRMDQYLYPYFLRDGLNRGHAAELLACALLKICERRMLGGDDVVNIAIAGYTPDGRGGVNELSYALMDAVEMIDAPGPNLSARMYAGIPDEFLDRALKLIGTGIGYPALMNDEVNIPALARHGYAVEDARNYCMVGCIENFIPGMQPPWSDGRFNTPKFLELALNRGECMLTGARLGPDTGDPAAFASMGELMDAFHAQLVRGAAEYVQRFKNENERYNRGRYTQPFLSCFCIDCIGRGLDIRDGGALYPSVHGAGCMGIGTLADALAAVERCVFEEHLFDMNELRAALKADFEGYEHVKRALLAAPKYGNDDDFADKYAVWYVEEMERLFAPYRTYDGGPFYTAIASNVANIPAGEEVAATPDGRNARAPLSDAASPTYGRDKSGPTAAFLSLSKPDYRLVSCGTVVNQKYGPEMFANPGLRKKLAAMIRAYFELGGQEVQINSVSREVLKDAMEHPEKYSDLVVRVSGFSAYYTRLDRKVQEDILRRTEQG